MENSVSNSDVPEIPTKSKSLDVQSLYGEKSRASEEQVEEGKALKRKRRSSIENNKEFVSGQVKKKRRKSRKEVSLSSFESISKKSNEGLNAVDVLKLHGIDSDGKNSKKKKNGQVIGDGNLQNSNSLVNIAGSFDGNVIPIPKKPRGLSRRKKFQKDHLSEEAGTSAKVSSDAQTVKLTDDSVIPLISSEGKQKKISDGHEENGSSKVNSARRRLKSEDGASVRHNSDSVKKRVRRNRRKEKKSEPQKQNSVKDFEPSVDNSSVALQYDDEENLEENAARMLSSRFDPSCTGFSGNCTASASPQSPNDLSFMPSYHGDITRAGVNQPAGSESNSADAAGRVLRPRKKHKVKGHVRKRRHFYEIFFRDLDAYWVLNRRIKVFWPLDQSWYFGLITNYDPETNLHHVKYDDRDEEWISLQTERFKLLLLPSEVPRKSGSKHLRRRGKRVDDEKRNMDPEDDTCINFTDSETIISWLNRSLKSSQLGIKKKRKTSHASGSYVPTMCSDDSIDTPLGRIIAGPSRMKADNLSRDTMCSKDRKPPFVYYRRRFRKNGQGLGCISDEGSGCRKVTQSVSFFSYAVDELGATEEYDIVLPLDPDNRLWSGENFGLLKFTVPWTDLEKVTLKIRIPLPWSYNRLFGARHVWVHQLLFQHGMMMTAWPKIRLEMLFVDNIVGLRFLLFEGCLMQAVALVCLVLATFHQPHGFGKFVDLQLPVTSIRFKFSGSLILERQLVFVIYNFSEVQASRWQRLDGKLKQHCSVAKHLPLAECTFDNIKIIQSGSNQLPFPSVRRKPVTAEGSRRRSRQGIVHMGVSRELANNMDLSSSRLDAKLRRFPPFVLSFTAAPSFFLSLHLKLLMEKNVASNSLQNHHPISLVQDSENCGRLMGSDFSLVNNRSDQINLENNMRYFLSQVATGSGFLPGAKSKVEIDALSISNDGDWIKSSNLNSELNVTRTSVGGQDSGNNENHGIANLHRHPCHQSGSEQHALGSSPSVSDDRSSPEKSETGRFSHFNGITVQIPPCNQFDSRSFDRGSQSARQPISSSEWNMNDCVIRSPNPTGPRSVWHRNRHNSGFSSFGPRSKLWSDGRPDVTHNDLVNGSRKPRTQISYLLPFGGYDFSSKPRSNHHRKGRTFSRIRDENEKMPNRSRSPRRNLELLSCDANILITEGDRGWRECGARVVLEFVDHKDWRLLVKLSGVTKYSYKAYQFLQPGTTNRHTHVMMWKGGKDWILEFPDRSQWTRFKEMHEECYNRNIRVASVKTIPIPGVRLIEEGEDAAIEVPFVRNCPKYYRQVETGVEMALNPSRVLYDLDSDDEEWIYNCRNSSDSSVNSPLEISEEMFERTMDMFEKIAYAQQRDDFTGDEIEELIVGVGPVDVIKAIFEHWKQKRKRKGFPLIRHLQPPLWEKYQQQVKEWEKAMNKVHNFQNGCKEKTTLNEKPPMFAFCLRPRGLEVPNKGSKHRSHRRLTTGGHNYGFYRDQDGLHNFGRRTNGFEDRGVGFFQNHEYSDASPWLQTSTSVISPRDGAGSGYLSMSSSDGSERNQRQRFHKNKVRKIGTFLSPRDSQMMAMSYNQRTGKRNGCGWNMSLPEWPSHQKQYHQPEGFQRLRAEQLDCSDLDEFRLRDASGAAQHASNMAKLKREKAQRLLYRADLAIHKATVALMIAEAIKTASSEKESDKDSSEDE